MADTSLGHEVIDTTLAILIAGVPILHGRILNLRIAQYHNLNHRSVELVLVTARSGTTLQIAHIRALVGHNQRTLELTRTRRIDAEIGRELHWATHTLRDVAERAIRKDCRIECRVEVVGIRHHRAQILTHQLGIIPNRLRHRAEDDSLLGQSLLKGGLHRGRVHHRINRHTRQSKLLLERNTQLIECSLEFGIDILDGSRLRLLLLRSRIVDNILKIYLGDIQMCPSWQLHSLPMAESLEAQFEQPLGLTLLLRYQAHNALIQTTADIFGFDIRGESIFILAAVELFNYIVIFFFHTFVISGKCTKKMQYIHN